MEIGWGVRMVGGMVWLKEHGSGGDGFGVGDGLGRSVLEYMCCVGRRVEDGDRGGRRGWRRKMG